ncbi:unnamed protein product [Dicrocoelium dendriticum]|nr:unnamed protein product [Dicrocoelium dendriticum]
MVRFNVLRALAIACGFVCVGRRCRLDLVDGRFGMTAVCSDVWRRAVLVRVDAVCGCLGDVSTGDAKRAICGLFM